MQISAGLKMRSGSEIMWFYHFTEVTYFQAEKCVEFFVSQTKGTQTTEGEKINRLPKWGVRQRKSTRTGKQP